MAYAAVYLEEIGHDVSVREHHAFGQACGAA